MDISQFWQASNQAKNDLLSKVPDQEYRRKLHKCHCYKLNRLECQEDQIRHGVGSVVSLDGCICRCHQS